MTTPPGDAHARGPDDRLFFTGYENLKLTAPLFQEYLTPLHDAMMLLESAVVFVSHTDGGASQPQARFANNVAALSGLIRAYQGLQAATHLAVLGYYTESRATIRGVYESAGIARMLAHDLPQAEKWIRKDTYVPDRHSREFAAVLNGGDPDAKIPHQRYYAQASASAHPSALTTLPYLLDPEGVWRPRLYPVFDAEQFKAVAFELTAEVLFVCFCLRNALADHSLLEPRWHRTLADTARTFSGMPMEHLDDNWEARERLHEGLKQHVRPQAEVNDFLREHPNSYDNVRARTEEDGEGV